MGRIHKLPKVNEKATKKAVERKLSDYRSYLITLPVSLLPKVTPSYSLVPPSHTNEFYSSTEAVAIERLEFERERNAFLEEVQTAVNTLKEHEREIIYRKYMEQEAAYDMDIWTDLGLGRTKFYKVQGEAMLRLAFALKIEVYRNHGEVEE